MKTAAVIGGGLTGLTAGFRLQERGVDVRVFEQSGRPGGVIHSTQEAGGFLFDRGPNSLQARHAEVGELLRDLDLESERVFPGPSARDRFILRDGRPRALPLSPAALLTTNLFSWRTKTRLVAELFRRPRARSEDCSAADLIREHFGSEVHDFLFDPFTSGTYAGDPEQLSARHAFPPLWEADRNHGSLIRGLLRSRRSAGGGRSTGAIFSFRGGLQTLPDRLAERLGSRITLGAAVSRIAPDGRGWRIDWKQGGAERRSARFDAILLAVPCFALAELEVGDGGGLPLARLSEVEHPPVATCFFGLPAAGIGHSLDGFGLLVPSRARRRILGVIFSSSLFPGRAPPGCAAVTVFVGGARDPTAALVPPLELLPAVFKEVRELLAISGEPIHQAAAIWPRAIPQYNLGFDKYLGLMHAFEAAHPGVFLAGPCRDGVSLGDCIRSAVASSAKLVTVLGA